MEAIQLFQSITSLPASELKKFHEMYLDFIEQQEWEQLSGATLEWDDENDDYSELLNK